MSCPPNIVYKDLISIVGAQALPVGYQANAAGLTADWLLVLPGIASSGGNIAPLGIRIYEANFAAPYQLVTSYNPSLKPKLCGGFGGELLIPWNAPCVAFFEFVGPALPASSQVDLSYVFFNSGN